MRKSILGLMLLSSTAFAENQYALVDSVNHQRSGISFLSFDVGVQDFATNGDVTLMGSMWHQEYQQFKDIQITVTKEAQDEVSDSGETIAVGKVKYRAHERTFDTEQSRIIRKMLVSEDGSTMVGLSDEPGPLAIAAILAGSAVVLCTGSVVYSMYRCDNPSLEIGFGPSGFQCASTCE